MHRRNLLTLASAMLPLSFAARANAATADAKVAYHLADLDKVEFVLGNIRNHFDGMGGPGNVTIVLVVHGPALKAFEAAGASPGVVHDLGELVKSGLQPNACIHTMQGLNITLADLLPGFTVAEKGGVVRLAELQAQGYGYLRP
jgi:intracellular sulfur oxidation DsrE/DsrF family protein